MDTPCLDIVTDNRRRVYFPGHPVTGHVTLDIPTCLKVKEIYIELTGSGYCEWKTKSLETEDGKISDGEEYCCITQVLFGKDPSPSEGFDLPAGRYGYRFAITIPLSVPSSYEGTNCFVRYVLMATLDMGSGSTKKMVMPINVANLLNLNTIEGLDLMASVNVTDKTTLHSCCRGSNYITATLKLDRTGYVPGETIVFNAEVTNLSNRSVRKTKVQLEMNVALRAWKGKYEYTHRRKLCKIDHGPIFAKRYDVYVNESLTIPPVPSSYLIGCNIIDIKYRLALVVFLPGMSSSLRVYSDIVIGGIPLAEVAAQHGVTLPVTPPPAAPSQKLTLPPLTSTLATPYSRHSPSPTPTQSRLVVPPITSPNPSRHSPSPIPGQSVLLSDRDVSRQSSSLKPAQLPGLTVPQNTSPNVTSQSATTSAVLSGPPVSSTNTSRRSPSPIPRQSSTLLAPPIMSTDISRLSPTPATGQSFTLLVPPTLSSETANETQSAKTKLPGPSISLSDTNRQSFSPTPGQSDTLTVPPTMSSARKRKSPSPKPGQSQTFHLQSKTSSDITRQSASPLQGQPVSLAVPLSTSLHVTCQSRSPTPVHAESLLTAAPKPLTDNTRHHIASRTDTSMSFGSTLPPKMSTHVKSTTDSEHVTSPLPGNSSDQTVPTSSMPAGSSMGAHVPPLTPPPGTSPGVSTNQLPERSRLSTRSPLGLQNASPFTHLIPQATFIESTTDRACCGLSSTEGLQAIEGFVPKYIRYTWKQHDPTELFTVTSLRKQHTTLSKTFEA